MDTATDLFSQDIKDLHTLGSTFATRWVTVHETTSANLTETFCATTVAKAAKATSFKRPENGVFRPGTNFGEFYFTETGDTNATSTANGAAGGWGGIFRLRQAGPSASTGTLSLVVLGDQEHTAFDNISFAGPDDLLVVEDAGDTLHVQRNALDSGYLYSLRHGGVSAPVRFLAEGRDASATIDSALGDAQIPGFVNDGDNEITGIHVSDGDPSAAGLLGAKSPRLFDKGWRLFWTAQHGDNVTFEIIPQAATHSRS
jgi:secreted PhoX family phosphatase